MRTTMCSKMQQHTLTAASLDYKNDCVWAVTWKEALILSTQLCLSQKHACLIIKMKGRLNDLLTDSSNNQIFYLNQDVN